MFWQIILLFLQFSMFLAPHVPLPIALKSAKDMKSTPIGRQLLEKYEQLIKACADDFKKHHDKMTDDCCKAVRTTMTQWHNKLFALDAQAVFKPGTKKQAKKGVKEPTEKQVKKLATDMGKVAYEEQKSWDTPCGKRVQSF